MQGKSNASSKEFLRDLALAGLCLPILALPGPSEAGYEITRKVTIPGRGSYYYS